ncbi:hypothetical protein EJ03DRAFT_220154 [Teratosphaeria nubilosa]|uniref:Uncharacterized protein n=1 Tax=Teratosphaeria nubilosa TaxID=161662 RepID=A0A6G1KWV6_9PEZI|nr:hypothetical protein EJ03DRAFT_220154 [Teratosphaeria nubilosa]
MTQKRNDGWCRVESRQCASAALFDVKLRSIIQKREEVRVSNKGETGRLPPTLLDAEFTITCEILRTDIHSQFALLRVFSSLVKSASLDILQGARQAMSEGKWSHSESQPVCTLMTYSTGHQQSLSITKGLRIPINATYQVQILDPGPRARGDWFKSRREAPPAKDG